MEYEAKGRTALLDITVKSAEEGALGDFSGFDTEDPLVRNAAFYYVRVQVENAGKKTFGNAEVPLWGISGANTLLPPVKFTSSFNTCPTEPLPANFKPGDKFSTCLVFLSPRQGKLEGVSYRPVVDVTPIEWRGEVEKKAAPKSREEVRRQEAERLGQRLSRRGPRSSPFDPEGDWPGRRHSCDFTVARPARTMGAWHRCSWDPWRSRRPSSWPPWPASRTRRTGGCAPSRAPGSTSAR